MVARDAVAGAPAGSDLAGLTLEVLLRTARHRHFAIRSAQALEDFINILEQARTAAVPVREDVGR